MPVETVGGHYGEFTVLVDGEPVVSAGQLAFLGILPTKDRVRTRVKEHLALPPDSTHDIGGPTA